MRERKNTVHDLIELLFADVATGELDVEALREALEDARDLGQLQPPQYDAYITRMKRLTSP